MMRRRRLESRETHRLGSSVRPREGGDGGRCVLGLADGSGSFGGCGALAIALAMCGICGVEHAAPEAHEANDSKGSENLTGKSRTRAGADKRIG